VPGLRSRGALRVLTALAVALLLLAGLDAALFRTQLYRGVLAPGSSAGSLEAAVDRLRALPADPARDVLVLGDSRIFEGLLPATAAAASAGLRFVRAAVPGTTPRCWTYLDAAVDPSARRFRALVIPVDTYADDDSAIGALDGNDRPFDLNYLVYRISPGQAWPLAASFSDPRKKVGYTLDLWLRAPLLRDDLQDLLRDPSAREAALRRKDAGLPPLGTLETRTGSLHGLRVDFTRGTLQTPPSVGPAERTELERQLLRPVAPSPGYGEYRRRWLGELVARYRAAGTPVIFVRIPTRPLHRSVAPPSGSLVTLAHEGAALLPQDAYVALERPELFADHDHLNIAGARKFSDLLGRDVSQALVHPPRLPVEQSPASPAAKIPTGTAGNPPVRPPSVYLGLGLPIAFQSYEFVVFFALCALLFYALPRRFRFTMLLLASWYFYARWNAWYLVFLWVLTASDFCFALGLERARGALVRRTLLSAGVAANLVFLGTLKYANFAGATLGDLVGATLGNLGAGHAPLWSVDWLVPVGISFHTFQSISYLADVYAGRQAAIRKPLDYALYIAFFPQLLAGPIVRAGRFFGELATWVRPGSDDVLRGVGEIALGLFKKTAIADQFATFSDAYFANPAAQPGAPAAWAGALAFAFQIYFDFSGYSDIAIGCARLLGFDFPANFRRPYLAASITEFWRRWHISLSTWLRDYVYIPLGGNRGGAASVARNLMLTMLLGGLWHGANWTFVAWGGYHGALLVGERALGLERAGDAPRGWVRFARIALTFGLVCVGWILFRAGTFAEAAQVARNAFAGGAGAWPLPWWPLALVAGAATVAVAQERGWSPLTLRMRPAAYGAALGALIFALQLLAWPGEAPPFVYFKF
jgi:alginate O-acetyltransferase complex protein AlgI